MSATFISVTFTNIVVKYISLKFKQKLKHIEYQNRNTWKWVEVKYSLKKHVKKQELAELFLNLSDSIDEDIPDVIWQGSEFEADIKQKDVSCDINYISTKKGGEFTIKVSWITPAAKKKKAADAAAKTKERLEKKTSTKTSAKDKKDQPIQIVKEDDIWAEEDNWEASSDDDDWDSSDYDDEW